MQVPEITLHEKTKLKLTIKSDQEKITVSESVKGGQGDLAQEFLSILENIAVELAGQGVDIFSSLNNESQAAAAHAAKGTHGLQKGHTKDRTEQGKDKVEGDDAEQSDESPEVVDQPSEVVETAAETAPESSGEGVAKEVSENSTASSEQPNVNENQVVSDTAGESGTGAAEAETAVEVQPTTLDPAAVTIAQVAAQQPQTVAAEETPQEQAAVVDGEVSVQPDEAARLAAAQPEEQPGQDSVQSKSVKELIAKVEADAQAKEGDVVVTAAQTAPVSSETTAPTHEQEAAISQLILSLKERITKDANASALQQQFDTAMQNFWNKQIEPRVGRGVEELSTVALLLKDLGDRSGIKQEVSAQKQTAPAVTALNAAAEGNKASENLRNNEQAAKAKALPRAVAVRTLEKVETALKEVAKSHDGKTISLRLDPPSLGQVKIDVTLKDGVLHARMIAENPQVNQMLREKSPDLQQILRKLGLNVDRVTVAVGWEQGNAGRQPGSDRGRERSAREVQVDTNVSAGAVDVANPAGTPGVSELDHWVA